MLLQFSKFLIFRNVDLGLYCAFNRNKRKHDLKKGRSGGVWGRGRAPQAKNSQKDPKHSKVVYPPLRLTCEIDTKNDSKMKQNCCENVFQIEVKIDPKWRVKDITLGGRGAHFGGILEVWKASGCQMSLGRRFGRIFSIFSIFENFKNSL